MNKIRILCICLILSGITLFVTTFFLIPSSSKAYGWCVGLASSIIILGLGYFINICILLNERQDKKHYPLPNELYSISIKEKSGFFVCKIMNILLCAYLLILNELKTKPVIMILGIALVVIQFAMDLIFQIILLSKSKHD